MIVPANPGFYAVYVGCDKRGWWFHTRPILAWQMELNAAEKDYVIIPISNEGLETECDGFLEPRGQFHTLEEGIFKDLSEYMAKRKAEEIEELMRT